MRNIKVSSEIIENRDQLTEREKANLAAAILNLQATLPSLHADAQFIIQWDAKDRESSYLEVAGVKVNQTCKRSMYVRELSGRPIWDRHYSAGCRHKNAGTTVSIYKLGISKVSKLGKLKCATWSKRKID